MTTFRTDFTTDIETFDYLESIDAENLTHEGKLALLVDFSTSESLIESVFEYMHPERFGNSYHYEELLKNLIETNQLSKLKNCHTSLSPLFDTELCMSLAGRWVFVHTFGPDHVAGFHRSTGCYSLIAILRIVATLAS